MSDEDIIRMAREAGFAYSWSEAAGKALTGETNMSGDHNMHQKATSFVEPFFIDIPKLARGAGITLSKNIQSQTRFHADLVSLDSFAFDVGERRLDHCLKALRQAGYDEAADYLQGVG